jgi:hypothetical protein
MISEKLLIVYARHRGVSVRLEYLIAPLNKWNAMIEKEICCTRKFSILVMGTRYRKDGEEAHLENYAKPTHTKFAPPISPHPYPAHHSIHTTYTSTNYRAL